MLRGKQSPKEAIILAGGSGTRLRSISGDLPKPMMPVCDTPFLFYLLRMLLLAGIKRTVLSLGYKHETVISYFGDDFKGMSLIYCIEESPLGTGGAIEKSIKFIDDNDLILLNGDSYFNIDIGNIFAYHVRECGDITIALKYLDDCSRFGAVSVNDNRIDAFREKGSTGGGYINGGIYIVNRRIVENMPTGRGFSFETDFLEKNTGTCKILPYICDGYFIDIGTPDDYQRAQSEFSGLLGNAL